MSFYNFLNVLEDKGYCYTACSTSGEKYVTRSKSVHGERLFFPSFGAFKYGLSLSLFWFLIRRQWSFRRVVINGLSNFPLVISALIALPAQQQVWLFTRGGLSRDRTRSWSKLKKIVYAFNLKILDMLSRSGRLLVIYQSEAERLDTCFDADNWCICGNYDSSIFEDRQVSFDTLRIVYLGRFSPEKGSDRLLTFARRLAEEKRGQHTLEIVVAGEEVAELGVIKNDNVVVHYNLSRDELDGILERSNVLLFPSRVENFGNALVEGVAKGLLPCVERDTHWAILLNENAAVDLNRLSRLVSDGGIDAPDLEGKSRRARKLVLKRFIEGRDFSALLERL